VVSVEIQIFARSVADGGLVAPAALIGDVEAEEPGKRAPRTSIFALDSPASPGAPAGADLEAWKVEATLGADRERAPPRVFKPKSGSEPGMISTTEMANWGMRSQLMVSPKPSLKGYPGISRSGFRGTEAGWVSMTWTGGNCMTSDGCASGVSEVGDGRAATDELTKRSSTSVSPSNRRWRLRPV
jgi:hypothetical protein